MQFGSLAQGFLPTGLPKRCHQPHQAVRSVSSSDGWGVHRRVEMSRQSKQDVRGPGWRSLAVASAGAAGVLLLLVASVGLIWLAGRSSSGAPALGAQPAPTPTPRTLSFSRDDQAASASVAELPASESESTAQEPGPSPAAPPTPAPGAASSTDGTRALDRGILLSAPNDSAFTSLASGSWAAAEDALRNDGTTADAEPWLTLAEVPGADFAIEAEIRVNGLIDTFCDQSFGLTGGAPGAERVFGGGVLFPCGDEAPRARLTDVFAWQDGYHADPLIAENAFDPGEDWRTYRFEIRGDSVRLVVDGVGIIAGSVDAPLEAAGGAEAGIWSQGVDLDVRSIEIFALPAS